MVQMFDQFVTIVLHCYLRQSSCSSSSALGGGSARCVSSARVSNVAASSSSALIAWDLLPGGQSIDTVRLDGAVCHGP
jgi:hypothetical protein